MAGHSSFVFGGIPNQPVGAHAGRRRRTSIDQDAATIALLNLLRGRCGAAVALVTAHTTEGEIRIAAGTAAHFGDMPFLSITLLTDAGGAPRGTLYLIHTATPPDDTLDAIALDPWIAALLCCIANARERAALGNRIAAMQAQSDIVEHALTGSGTGIWDRDVRTGEIHYSAAWKALLGYAPHEIGSRIEDAYQRLHPDDLSYVQNAMRAHFESQTDTYSVEHRILCKDGSYKWICSRGKVISRDAEGHALRMAGTTTDITERKRIEAELQQMASIDFLTQLPNRRHFMTRCDDMLRRMQAGLHRHAAVLMFDLDKFKALNDRWGHGVGDRALMHFASFLRAGMRTDDIVGRLGGEEFAMVLPDATLEDAVGFARRIQVRMARSPLRHEDEVVSMTVSIGIDCILPDDAHAQVALSRGDAALYLAKARGRNRIELGESDPARRPQAAPDARPNASTVVQIRTG